MIVIRFECSNSFQAAQQVAKVVGGDRVYLEGQNKIRFRTERENMPRVMTALKGFNVN